MPKKEVAKGVVPIRSRDRGGDGSGPLLYGQNHEDSWPDDTVALYDKVRKCGPNNDIDTDFMN